MEKKLSSPKFIYKGGKMLTEVLVQSIFWGKFWQEERGEVLAKEVNAFYRFILRSELLAQLEEYSSSEYTFGMGSLFGSISLANAPIAKIIHDSDIRTSLLSLIETAIVPQAKSDLLYCIYMPPDVRVNYQHSLSGSTFCGYHDAIDRKIFYAVIPYPDGENCHVGRSIFDSLTILSSHELCEAILDPIPGTGWIASDGEEIGDVCSTEFKKIGKYWVQKEWSNNLQSCR